MTVTVTAEADVRATLSVEVLKNAKRTLQQRGWTKGELVDCTTGEVCALGALAVNLGVEVTRQPELDDFGNLYRVVYPYEHLEPTAAQQAAVKEAYDAGLERGDFGPWAELTKQTWAAYDEAEEQYLQTFYAYQDLLREALIRVTGNSLRSVPIWNDNEARTVDDVIAVFDEAIGILKESKQ